MRGLIKKIFVLLLMLFVFGIAVSCGDDNKPNEQIEEKNFEITLNIGEEKVLDINNTYKYDALIDDKSIISFEGNIIKALKSGQTNLVLTTNDNKLFKYTYKIIVKEELKELSIDYKNEMNVGDKQTFVVKGNNEVISDYELFTDKQDLIKFNNHEIIALKEGSASITVVATIDGTSIRKTVSILIKAKEIAKDELVVSISNTLYANQTVAFTICLKDGTEIDDFEMISSNEDLLECYPEDKELSTFDAGEVTITFTATVDGKEYKKELNITILPELRLELDISDIITTEKIISYKVTVKPYDVELEEFEVSSSDKKIFTVSGNEITPLSPGKALLIINGTYNGARVSASKQITVKEYVADEIYTNLDNFMIVNNTLALDVSIKPSNSEVSDLVITSSDSSVILVSDKILTALKVGSAKITISCKNKATDTTLTKEIDVNVINVESIEIKVSEEIYVNEVASFVVYAKPSNTIINQSSLNLIYKTKNDGLLINDHAIFGVTAGSNEVEVELLYSKSLAASSLSKLSAKASVSVIEPTFPIERLTISTGAGMIVGGKEELVVSKYPENGIGDVEITSSNNEVIAVNGTELTALKEGKSEIKVSLVGNDSVCATISITVVAKKDVVEVSDGLFNGEPTLARYKEESIKNYYELMCGVKETTYIGYTSTRLDGDVDGYSGMTGNIVHDEYYAQNVHVLEVPSRKDVVVVPWANLNNHKWSLTTVKGLIGNFEEHNPGYKVIAAVNGDFFDINANKNLPYSTTGENVSNGEFYKVSNDFSNMGGTIGFTNDGSNKTLIASANTGPKYSDYFVLDIYDENNNIIKSFHVSAFNDPQTSEDTCLYYGTYNDNKDYVPITPSGTNTFIVENSFLALPSNTYDFYGKGVVTTKENKELNIGDFAITTSNEELLQYLKVGSLVRVQRVFVGDFSSVKSATGYNGVVFDENGIVDFKANGNLSNRAPRTVIGMKEDGTLIMMVVDGRQGLKDMFGCDGYELTAIMRAYGCINAYNVDGGGSSTIVVRSEDGLVVLNSPSDGHERSDGNCILICTVDPNYQTEVKDIKETSARVSVSTDIDEYKQYDVYINLDNKMIKLENGEVELTNLVHNNKYNYRVYYKKGEEFIATQTVGSFETPKAGFKFLGLYIEEKTDSFVLHAYSLDNDKAGNVYEMTVFFNDKTVYLKNSTLEIKKEIYGDKIEKIGYEYWYTDENGRNIIRVNDGLYFCK